MSNDKLPALGFLQKICGYVQQDAYSVRNNADGKYCAVHEALPNNALQGHLLGTSPPLALYPITAGGDTTQLCVLDFDDHDGTFPAANMKEKVVEVATLLAAVELKPCCFRSGGGKGYHLWMFFAEPQKASVVRKFMRNILKKCGLREGAGGVEKKKVEIFPKQDAVPNDGVGSCIALPLARASVPTYGGTMEEIPLEKWANLGWHNSPTIPETDVLEIHVPPLLSG